MLKMAPQIATGLGLTETSGFCTYTALTNDAGALARGIGWAMPAYPMSIRQPMNGDGSAGAEVSAAGNRPRLFQRPADLPGLCQRPGSHRRRVVHGWLAVHRRHGPRGRARSAFLRPRQVAAETLGLPGLSRATSETHFSSLAAQVANIGVVGHPHRMWSEGIIAFVEKRPGADLTEAELRKHARSLTAYMRPLHYVILEPGAMPLNRTAKVDVVRLQELAKEEVARLRRARPMGRRRIACAHRTTVGHALACPLPACGRFFHGFSESGLPNWQRYFVTGP
jgi:fatty-acyl-CoA synthase